MLVSSFLFEQIATGIICKFFYSKAALQIHMSAVSSGLSRDPEVLWNVKTREED